MVVERGDGTEKGVLESGHIEAETRRRCGDSVDAVTEARGEFAFDEDRRFGK